MFYIGIVNSFTVILAGFQVVSVCEDFSEENSKISKNHTNFDKIANIEKSVTANSYLFLGG